MINYRGERFSGYNKPKSTPGQRKKSAVLAKQNGKVKLVRFGDPNMKIKKHIEARRKSLELDINAKALPINYQLDIGLAKHGKWLRKI